MKFMWLIYSFVDSFSTHIRRFQFNLHLLVEIYNVKELKQALLKTILKAFGSFFKTPLMSIQIHWWNVQMLKESIWMHVLET